MTVADLASRSSLPLATARIELNKMALDTRGRLEVSTRGDILYSFSKDFEAVYEARGTKLLLQKFFSHVFDITFYILRVSFGILMIASFITISVVFACALCVILIGLGEAGDGDFDGLDFDFFEIGDLGMFFAWSTIFQARTPDSYQGDRYMGMDIEVPDRGFFYNCFSFLFGDGDPNHHKEDEQWRFLAEVIRRNSGVVIAEQLAPYTLKNRTDSNAMLPILVHFDGSPEVTETGNIAYVFPSLQVTAHQPGIGEIPACLQEDIWKFSNLPVEKLHWVFFFAGANLCGAYALYHHLSWFDVLMPYAGYIYLIMVYAMFFMGFPIVRQCFNIGRNVAIDMRNSLRTQAAANLRLPQNQKKIAEVEQFAQQRILVTSEQMVYTTDRDEIEQRFEQQFPETAEASPEASEYALIRPSFESPRAS
ncbi:MAG: hypothetical protein K2W95_02265 [Candidatus Obscuribacterales bacterium]|nr:hypothetical protein [Candidatus Obscuribacterales bacterium]